MSNESSDLDLLTTEQVAEKLQVTPRTVVAYIKRGDLSAVSLNQKNYRIYRKDLDKFLADRHRRSEEKR